MTIYHFYGSHNTVVFIALDTALSYFSNYVGMFKTSGKSSNTQSLKFSHWFGFFGFLLIKSGIILLIEDHMKMNYHLVQKEKDMFTNKRMF